ncbi:glutamine synthetase-like [Physella acuta]|uniref:glutamine synthetase-like n=1 Tax=Physella acuta TaxID=109671 RepID=UPI0027DD04A4|nr:glutamine synthetase-like [Physella acuta]XP_059174080.1 glutamine synthetase-like [Physella acuta]XP_059174081.1 glutamine synthetase-like [Physella acuta]
MSTKKSPVVEVVETPFYETEKRFEADGINGYDSVLFTVCDIFGRPRGKFAVGRGIQRFVKEGMEMPHTTCVLGFNSEPPKTIPKYSQGKSTIWRMFPDLSTLRRLSWLCKDGKKVGQVLCDLYDSNGDPEMYSPREIAKRQIAALKDIGFQILSAHEAEYMMFHKGTLNPMGGNFNDVINMLRLDGELSFLYDNMTGLLNSGIPVETQMEEFQPGQVEYSLQPQYGIKMADCVHRLRYVAKAVAQTGGFDAIFMTRPKAENQSNGYHLNHSLWTLDGKNAFYDPNGDHKCSDILRHWVAGLILHANALLALFNPTLNCYERLHGFFSPSDNVWNYDDRNARLRVKTKGKNIHIEDRSPSSASNPYLVIAGLIAAGMDGIVNKLECPPPVEFRPLMSGDERAKTKNPLAKTMDEALQALGENTVLKRALGEDFVNDYIALCKEFQIDKLKEFSDKEPSIRFEAARKLFLYNL